MPFRISFIYDQTGDRVGGWSENFWNESAGLGAAVAVAEAIKPAAEAVHGRQTVLRAIRVAEYNAQTFRQTRVTRTIRYTGNVNSSAPTTTVAQSDYQAAAAGLELRSGDVYSVRSWIRGVWDSAIKSGGVWSPDPSYVPRIKAYTDALSLQANNMRLLVTNKTNQGKPLLSITQTGLCTVTAHGWTSGQRIRISGTKGVAGLNKTWVIQVQTADTFFITPWTVPTAPPVFTQLGEARLLSPTLVPLTYAAVIRASKRDVGRPFGLLIGAHRRA